LAALSGRPTCKDGILVLHNCASEANSRVQLALLRADHCRLVQPAKNPTVEEAQGLPCLLMFDSPVIEYEGMGQGRGTAECFKSGTRVLNELQEAAQTTDRYRPLVHNILHDLMAEPRHPEGFSMIHVGSYTTPKLA
jgi:hypothetical protein